MKKTIALLMLIFAVKAQAGLLTIDISNDSPVVGDVVNVNILVNGLADTDLFTIDLVFDTASFSYNETTLSSDLFTTNPFSFFQVNAYQNRIALSFLDFEPIRTADFVLASFDLTVLQSGHSDFSFSNVKFYAPVLVGGLALIVDSSDRALINATSIPEPATWLLLPFALLFFARRS